MMAEYGRTLEDILDGFTLPQFRLLTKARAVRKADDRRWQLQLVGFNLQTQEAADAWQESMDELADVAGGYTNADMGGGFTVSKRLPLLHELTPAQVRASRGLRRIIKFKTVQE